jgi:DNA-binding response OmpR family regulator
MKKILIAIDKDFLREAYKEVFKTGGFKVLTAKNGKEALDSVKKEKVDLILADVSLDEIDGFELFKKIKREKKGTSVIIMDQYENKENRKKAMDMEAKDFITFSSASPNEILRRIKIILGEQKSYRIKISNIEEAKDLYKDMGYNNDLKCSKCGADLELNLIRDLSTGSSHFVVSFACPNNCE